MSFNPLKGLQKLAQEHEAQLSGKPSLGALAVSHLAGGEHATLGALASGGPPSKDKSGPQTSLSALAKNHLAQDSSSENSARALFVIPSLKNPASSTSRDTFGLAEGNSKQAVHVPDLFGGEKNTDAGATTPSTIDLMQALRLVDQGPRAHVDEVDDGQKIADDARELDETDGGLLEENVQIFLDSLAHFVPDDVQSLKEESEPSGFGLVLCRRWGQGENEGREVLRPPKRHEKLVHFLFDSPSPDDVVLKAQSQVFKRSR